MSKKHLHRHSLPVALILGIGLAGTALSYTAYQSIATPGALRQGLTAHTINITPTRYGLAKISIKTKAAEVPTTVKPTPVVSVPAEQLTTTRELATHSSLAINIQSATKHE